MTKPPTDENTTETSEAGKGSEISQRPPLDLTVSLRLRELGTELLEHWSELEENCREAIDTPFPGVFLPTHGDGFAVWDLLHEMANALGGIGPWTQIRRAHAAMMETRSKGEQQALAIARCEAVQSAWKRISRRDFGTEHERRKEENWHAKALILALGDIEPSFRRLQRRDVRSLLARQRENASPVTLLHELAKRAEVWPDSSPDALKKARAKKRKPGS